MSKFMWFLLVLMVNPSSAQNGSLTLLTPNGGEGWRLGTTQRIEWSASGLGGDFRIELSRDGGTTYEFIAVTSSGSNFDWTVSGLPTTEARIRVTNVHDGVDGLSDASDADFTIGVEVTFRVRMSVKLRDGAFVPSLGDVVSVSGSFNNFAPGVDLLQDSDGDSVYTTTLMLTTPLGTSISYRYWKTPRSGYGLEDPPDRVGTLSSASTVLPIVFFNNENSSGSPPPAPSLNSPSNGAQNQPTALTLAWNASPAATTYRLQLSPSPNFSTLQVDDSTITTTSRQVDYLGHGTTYSWRVNAKNEFGTSSYSNVWSFATTADAPPPTPVPDSPPNGASDQPTTVTISWNASGGARSYQLQVSTTPTFTSFIVNESGLTSTSRVLTTLAQGVTYYWHVNASNPGGTSAYSDTWSFTIAPAAPSSAPTLISPPDGATDIPQSLILSWSPVQNATRYRVRLSTTPTFATVIVDDPTITTTSRQVGPLSPATTHYWQVSGSNGSGSGPFSTTQGFTTASSAPPVPATPAQLNPPNGAVEQPTTVTFLWGPSIGATSYRLQVALDPLFGETQFDDSAITATTRSVTSLRRDTTYYWRVSAQNSSGASQFSGAWSFETVSDPPGAPRLLAPTDRATDQPTLLTLSWEGTGEGSSYRLQLSTRSNFTSLILDVSNVTTTSYQVGPLENSTTYYWRVRARRKDKDGNYSSVWRFTTTAGLPQAPSAPSLQSPPNNAMNQPVNPTLSWSPSNGATAYGVQVSTSPAFPTLVFENQALITTSVQIGPLSGNTAYYWRVNARNDGGVSSYSTTRQFTTEGQPVTIAATTSQPIAGNALTVSLTLSDGFEPTSGLLYYRNGGEQSYRTSNLSFAQNSATAQVPAPYVNSRGVEFYARVSDGIREATYPQVGDPASTPAAVRVQGIVETSPVAIQPMRFAMVSVPMELTEQSIGEVMSRIYGVHDLRSWRVFRWQDTAYVEFPQISSGLMPGSAYWLVVATSKQLSVKDGNSTNSSSSYQIVLQPGWNQVGNPFAFTVAWSDVLASSGLNPTIVQEPVGWDVATAEYRYEMNVVEPWQGYFVFNWTNGPITLRIPPVEASGAFPKNAMISSHIAESTYRLQMIAEVPDLRARDAQNFIGLTNAPEDVKIVEAPPMDDRIQLSIVDGRQRLARSLKHNVGDGQTWEIEVNASDPQHQGFVSLQEEGTLPAGCQVFVLDRDDFAPVAISNRRFAVSLNSRYPKRSFRVIVGTPEYAAGQADGIPLTPIEYVLRQNFPNPFNPATTIQYQLARRSDVILDIFNVAGQRVKMLVNGEQLTGTHSVTWDGTNESGTMVSSGVYFCVLRANAVVSQRSTFFTDTKKLILIR
jgi:hypothetical protein